MAAAATEGTWRQALLCRALLCQAFCHTETPLPPPLWRSGAAAEAGFSQSLASCSALSDNHRAPQQAGSLLKGRAGSEDELAPLSRAE